MGLTFAYPDPKKLVNNFQDVITQSDEYHKKWQSNEHFCE
jgi:hypothetical protein